MKIQRLYGTRRNLCRVLMFTAAFFTLAIQASAAPAGGGLPWEAPMTANGEHSIMTRKGLAGLLRPKMIAGP